jgi:hypothetical protein
METRAIRANEGVGGGEMKTLMGYLAGVIIFLSGATLCAQEQQYVRQFVRGVADSLPSDLPIPTIRIAKVTGDGYMYAAVPYWGKGSSYLVAYDNTGRPAMYKKVATASMDFKMQENGFFTYYDNDAKKFILLDSALTAVGSFSAQNGFTTDGHDLKILENGHVLLIGYAYKNVDMSVIVQGGSSTANVAVNAIQELDGWGRVVFEWRADEHFQYTDVGPEVNLLDMAFEFTHINSIDLDRDGGLIISSRHLDEITKIDRKTGAILWRFGGKNNQFRFTNDTIGFSAQHAARVLPNGNILLFDNGVYHTPHVSRALEYSLDTVNKTATLVWSYGNTPDVASVYWGNAQRLDNGNTFVGWGYASIAATEVDTAGNTVFEMTFPPDVYSYRMYRIAKRRSNAVSSVSGVGAVSGFILDQNYPNPFNPTTTISLSLPSRSFVSLKVFDVMGRDVATVVSEELPAGNYKRQWNASGFPSGVYFFRLQAGAYTETKRIVLLR